MTTCIINKYRQICDVVIKDIKKDCGGKISFNPAEQYVTNTMLTVECAECSKLCML